MSNRMLRDWTSSFKIFSLSVHAERFFVRLIMKADDYGCFFADARLLKANLFPLLLDSIRDADILRWTAECEKAGLIIVYENSGKKYLQILDFRQRLDRAKKKYPLPTANDSREVVNEIPPEREVEREREVEGADNDDFLEMFKRSAPRTFTDQALLVEIGKFKNKYPEAKPRKSGALINAWVARMENGSEKKMVL